jgi:hypothetical protein
MQTLILKNKKFLKIINFQSILDGIFLFLISSRFDPLYIVLARVAKGNSTFRTGREHDMIFADF